MIMMNSITPMNCNQGNKTTELQRCSGTASSVLAAENIMASHHGPRVEAITSSSRGGYRFYCYDTLEHYRRHDEEPNDIITGFVADEDDTFHRRGDHHRDDAHCKSSDGSNGWHNHFNCKYDDEEEEGDDKHGGRRGSSVSSLSPPPCSSMDGTRDFARRTSHRRRSLSLSEGSDGDRHAISSGSGDRGLSGSPPSPERLRKMEDIVRPGNPPPPPPSNSTSVVRVASATSSQCSSSVRSPLRVLLERVRRRHRSYWVAEHEQCDAKNDDCRPPGQIYLPGPVRPDGGVDRRIIVRKTDCELRAGLLQAEIDWLRGRRGDTRASLEENDERTNTMRLELIRSLAACGGDAKDAAFVSAVEALERLRTERLELVNSLEEATRMLNRRGHQLEGLRDTMQNHSPAFVDRIPPVPSPSMLPASSSSRHVGPSRPGLEGHWFTLTKPTYTDCLGFNERGNPMYTLGRMSFEMFRPGNLVLSIEAVFNPIEEVVVCADENEHLLVPKTLAEEVGRILEGADGTAEEGDGRLQKAILRTYK